MRLYPHPSAGAVSALTNPTTGQIVDVDASGGFDLDDADADRLLRFHTAAGPMWETDLQRQTRLVGEEMERRRDPATMLAVVEQLMAAAAAVVPAVPAPAVVPDEVKTPVGDPVEAADGAPAEVKTPAGEPDATPAEAETPKTTRRSGRSKAN